MPQSDLFIGPDSIKVVPKIRNLGFVLNKNLTPVDHQKAKGGLSENLLRFDIC
jgi:hypothetical protein